MLTKHACGDRVVETPVCVCPARPTRSGTVLCGYGDRCELEVAECPSSTRSCNVLDYSTVVPDSVSDQSVCSAAVEPSFVCFSPDGGAPEQKLLLVLDAISTTSSPLLEPLGVAGNASAVQDSPDAGGASSGSTTSVIIGVVLAVLLCLIVAALIAIYRKMGKNNDATLAPPKSPTSFQNPMYAAPADALDPTYVEMGAARSRDSLGNPNYADLPGARTATLRNPNYADLEAGGGMVREGSIKNPNYSAVTPPASAGTGGLYETFDARGTTAGRDTGVINPLYATGHRASSSSALYDSAAPSAGADASPTYDVATTVATKSLSTSSLSSLRSVGVIPEQGDGARRSGAYRLTSQQSDGELTEARAMQQRLRDHRSSTELMAAGITPPPYVDVAGHGQSGHGQSESEYTA